MAFYFLSERYLMPKFDSKEEYLKWKEGKLQQGKEEPVPQKEQLPVDNNANNDRRFSVKAVYIFPAILFILAILYFIAKPFDYSKGPSLIQSTNHKEDKIDAASSNKPEQETLLTHIGKEESEYKSEPSKPEQELSPVITAEKEESEITKPEASTAKPTFPEIVKQARKAVVTIKTSKGVGSGFLISPDGKIVTNTHVVGKEETVEVAFASGVSEKARVVMKGTILPESLTGLDIAILEINSHRSDYDYLPLGDSSECIEGMDVIAIGSPRGLTDTTTKGIISNCKRGEASGVHYIQTDTPISSGNSGGPLIDSNGKVIGVNSWKIKAMGFEGLGFAIAINVVKDFMSWKLSYLEEKFRSEREERTRKLVKDFEEIWERARSQYKSMIFLRLYRTTDRSRLNFSQELEVDRIAQKKEVPPAGFKFNSLKKWFEAMAEGVIDNEITVEQVVNVIRNHFSYYEP